MKRSWMPILLAACQSGAYEPDPESGCDESQQCVYDPWPHCISKEGCHVNDDCPSGLTCQGNTASLHCAAPVTTPSCRWAPGAINRLALVNGFEVPTMSLNISPSPLLRFTWTAPPTAELVACAVFTCNPVIASSETAPREMISNASACILDFQTMDAGGSWLSSPYIFHPAHTPSCLLESEHSRIIEFTAVGCWAYSGYAIVAASELVKIDPAALTGGRPSKLGIPSDDTCDADDDPCYDKVRDFFGACVAGQCQPRCTSAADCELAAHRFFGTTSTHCEWECQPVAGSQAGVCVLQP